MMHESPRLLGVFRKKGGAEEGGNHALRKTPGEELPAAKVFVRTPWRTQPFSKFETKGLDPWEKTKPGARPPIVRAATMQKKSGFLKWSSARNFAATALARTRSAASGMPEGPETPSLQTTPLMNAVLAVAGLRSASSLLEKNQVPPLLPVTAIPTVKAQVPPDSPVKAPIKVLVGKTPSKPAAKTPRSAVKQSEKSPSNGASRSPMRGGENTVKSPRTSTEGAKEDGKAKAEEESPGADQQETPRKQRRGFSNVRMKSLTKPLRIPHYMTEEFRQKHYFPETREATLDYGEFLPLLSSMEAGSLELQQDSINAIYILSTNGDENKTSFGKAGAVEDLLNLSQCDDMRVRFNAVQALSNLLTHEHNRSAFYSWPGAVECLVKLTNAKVQSDPADSSNKPKLVQPFAVQAMRAATEALAHLAECDSTEHKKKFMESGLIKPLCKLTRSLDKDTRMAAVRGVLLLCMRPGMGDDMKWQRKIEVTSIEWTSEQILDVVSAANSSDPEVTKLALLGLRFLCTPAYIAIMLSRSDILNVLRKSLRGELFERDFSSIMAAISLLSALADCVWPNAVLEDIDRFIPMLATLLSLLPSTREEVVAMQSARGAMATWGHDELMRKAAYVMSHPECGPSEVGEIFPQAFRQLQCFVLVEDVLDVSEKLMMKMIHVRCCLFHLGAAKSFVTLHLYTNYRSAHIKCLRALCLMAGSEKLAACIGNNRHYLDIIDFALSFSRIPALPKTCVISIKELSKDLDSIEPLIHRGLVQSLGRLTDTNDPTLQTNLIMAFTNLARKRVAKDQIAELAQWPNIVHFADSFDPGVRREASNLFMRMASGEDSIVCRNALHQLVSQLKQLTRSSRISPEVAKQVSNYVNQIEKVVLAQAVIRGFIARRRVKKLKLAKREREKKDALATKSGNDSAVFSSLNVFSPTVSDFAKGGGTGVMPKPPQKSPFEAAARTPANKSQESTISGLISASVHSKSDLNAMEALMIAGSNTAREDGQDKGRGAEAHKEVESFSDCKVQKEEVVAASEESALEAASSEKGSSVEQISETPRQSIDETPRASVDETPRGSVDQTPRGSVRQTPEMESADAGPSPRVTALEASSSAGEEHDKRQSISSSSGVGPHDKAASARSGADKAEGAEDDEGQSPAGDVAGSEDLERWHAQA